MPGISEYERMQIQSLLQPRTGAPIRPGSALILVPDGTEFRLLAETVIVPALMDCDVHIDPLVRVFDSDSPLSEISAEVATAEVIIADMSLVATHVLYVLGLCHAIGRCPILLTRDSTQLPFNLAALRYVEYQDSGFGRKWLREELTRAVRVFLYASRQGK